MRGIFITLSNISKGNAFPHQGVTNCVKYECSTQDSGTPFPNSVTTPFYFALLAKYRDKGHLSFSMHATLTLQELKYT